MFRKVIGTLGSRIFCTLIAFGIVIINSHEFGSEGLGTIGLFILGITILQNLTSFVGGPSLVYMLPRNDNFQLIFLSYVFNLLINIAGSILLVVFHLIEKEFLWQLLGASIFFSFYYLHSLVILSQEKIKIYNILALCQIILQLSLMLIFLYFFKIKNVSAYIYAYLFSYALVWLSSISLVWKNLRFSGFKNLVSLFKQMIIYGFVIQIANLAQLLNYRLSYYIIEFCSGRQPLGLFDLGTKLSEAIWILPKSMATVQYSKISNCEKDKVYAQKLTLAFLKVAFVFALLSTSILLCIPSQWIGWIFGLEFVESKLVIIALGFGIIILSCNIILSHYFSGFGKYKINTIASVIGLIITAGLGLSFIQTFTEMPYMKVIVSIAAITSFSYTVSFVFTFFCFLKDTQLKIKDFKIKKNDFQLLLNEIKKTLISGSR
ncbi:MAG: hypothetical protein KBA86_00510 [Bacteroidales bacterium]|nr:hypothetical protein [Bacteroidales bacterium]